MILNKRILIFLCSSSILLYYPTPTLALDAQIKHPHSNYLSIASKAKLKQKHHQLLNRFNSKSAFLIDHTNNEIIYDKNPDLVAPIASITKLMSAMVVLDSGLDLNEVISINENDIDYLKNSRSNLGIGFRIRRADALLLMLMSSDNRAASALSRHYPTGKNGFVQDMNKKAQQLGMSSTKFIEPTGLSSNNISSARDLALMITTANNYPIIRQFSTTKKAIVYYLDKTINFVNTNPKIRNVENDKMDIVLSKTGYIRESGYCLVMTAYFKSRPISIILMDAKSRKARYRDIAKISKWADEML